MTVAIRLTAVQFGFPTSAPVLLRSIAHMFLSSIALVTIIDVSPLHLPAGYRRMLFIRGLFGTFAMVFVFKSLSYLPAGEATFIFACSPILTMLLSKVVLREASSVWDMVCALLALLGVWLIASPDASDVDDDQHIFGALIVLLGACFLAAGFVGVRGMGTRVHFMLSVFALGIIGTPVTAVLGGYAAMDQLLSNQRGTGVMFLGSLSAFGAQSFLNKGLQSSKAGQGIILKDLEVPFVYILELLVLGEKSSAVRISGSLLVVCAVVIMRFRSRIGM
ncbi:EamA-like transporter [Gracilaria domingensis]|nr:EamA-like transporter [Gracilaria domingensis]